MPSQSPRDANIDLLSRYVLATSRRDWAALAGLFTPDAKFAAKRSPGFGEAEEIVFAVEGPAAIVEATAGPLESVAASHVILSGHVVDDASDGYSARVTCFFRAHHAGKGERAHLFEESLGRFELETVRMGEDWKIARMDEIVTIMLGTPEVFGFGG
jgi:hypothetical protein